MLHQLFIYTLLAHTLWAMPVEVVQPQQPHPVGDIASHIVIVTPQAQVHLEPALKYDAAAPFLQHLTPLARFASPNEETIVYYPASSAAAAAIPSLVSLEGAAITRIDASPGQTKQYEQVLEQIQTAIQSGAAATGQQLSEAASAAALAAASAGSSLFPGLFPSSENRDPKPAPGAAKEELKQAASPPLITDGRSFYALTPAGALPHIIDFVHAPLAGPVLVGPVQAIRARSIESPDMPIVALPIPEAPKPEALPMNNNKKKTELKENKDTKKIETEKEKEKLKSNEFGRFLEANALKETQGSEQKFELNLKKEVLKAEEEIVAAKPEESVSLTDKLADVFPQTQTITAADAIATANQVSAVAGDELTQSKVA